MQDSNQLYFDADYTTRAIAIGVKPTREYITIGQLLDKEAEENYKQREMFKDWRDYEINK